MSLVVFYTHMNIYDLERFKELPYELQDMIAHYTHEGYNLKWFNYNTLSFFVICYILMLFQFRIRLLRNEKHFY